MDTHQFRRNHNIIIKGFKIFLVTVNLMGQIRENQHKSDTSFWMRSFYPSYSGFAFFIKVPHATRVKNKIIISLYDFFQRAIYIRFNRR